MRSMAGAFTKYLCALAPSQARVSSLTVFHFSCYITTILTMRPYIQREREREREREGEREHIMQEGGMAYENSHRRVTEQGKVPMPHVCTVTLCILMSMCKCVFMSVHMPVGACYMHSCVQMYLENIFTMQPSICVHVFIFAHVHGFKCVQGCVQVSVCTSVFMFAMLVGFSHVHTCSYECMDVSAGRVV